MISQHGENNISGFGNLRSTSIEHLYFVMTWQWWGPIHKLPSYSVIHDHAVNPPPSLSSILHLPPSLPIVNINYKYNNTFRVVKYHTEKELKVGGIVLILLIVCFSRTITGRWTLSVLTIKLKISVNFLTMKCNYDFVYSLSKTISIHTPPTK